MGEQAVLYATVAFWEKSGCKIIADYSQHEDPTYRAIVLSTIDRLKPSEDNKISVDQGKCTVHVLIGELHYACLTYSGNYSSGVYQLKARSHMFLEKLRSVYREVPIVADLSRDLASLSGIDLSEPLQKIVDEYNREDAEECRVNGELIEIRRTLMDGVQKLVDQRQRSDDFVLKTHSLRIMSRSDYEVLTTTSHKKNIVVATSAGILMFLSTSLFIFLLYIGVL